MSNTMKNSTSQYLLRESEMDVSHSTSKNILLKPRSDCSTQTQAEENNSQVKAYLIDKLCDLI